MKELNEFIYLKTITINYPQVVYSNPKYQRETLPYATRNECLEREINTKSFYDLSV